MTESSNQIDKVISKIQKLLAMAADTSGAYRSQMSQSTHG